MDMSAAQAKGAVGKSPLHAVAPALWTAACYYLGAQVGLLLATAPVPMANLRPGAAVLLAALLGRPWRTWPPILLAVLPVHLLVYLKAPLGLDTALAWFAGNCMQAVLGAAGAAWLLRAPLRLDRLRHALVFVGWCAFAAPALAALPEVGMLGALGLEAAGFGEAWGSRTVSSALAILALVPPRASAGPGTARRLLDAPLPRQLEGGVLVLALAAAGSASFAAGVPDRLAPALAYLPLPLVFWTVVRFGAFGASWAFLLFAGFFVAGTAAGHGPFAGALAQLALPLFLAAVAVPMLLLSAALQERRGVLASLQREQEKLGAALASHGGRDDVARERRARARAEHEAASRCEELQRQREQLAHLTRVAVLGELSGALAHELNQPLAAILANAQAARRLLARPGASLDDIREILDDIIAEDKRAGEVIRRLRALFRKGAVTLAAVDLGDLVRDTVALVQGRLVAGQVTVELDLQAGLAARADRVQLQQVLLNLIVNACDAMEATPREGRHLRLSTSRLADGRVQIEVADGGPGIAPQLAGKVFEPFFTTKAEGLGFGLSISREIVQQHGGDIDAANDPAGGCVLRVRLPAYRGVE
jgi:signal transduction histidine kinase